MIAVAKTSLLPSEQLKVIIIQLEKPRTDYG